MFRICLTMMLSIWKLIGRLNIQYEEKGNRPMNSISKICIVLGTGKKEEVYEVKCSLYTERDICLMEQNGSASKFAFENAYITFSLYNNNE